MTRFKLIFKSFIHYLKANLIVATGVAISTAVLTGALIIGDSVTFSLEQSAFYRLGSTTHLVSTVDRYFRAELATDLAAKGGFEVAPALILEGMAVADGGEERVNKVQITGIDDRFEKIAESPIYLKLSGNEVIISTNLAERLKLKKGDSFLARIKKASLIPLNAPFVPDAETNISFRAVVKEIADQHSMGFFNLKNSQTAPYNLFLSLSKLNDLMKFDGKSNQLLISATQLNNQQISSLLDECFTAEDAGLKVKEISLTNEKEITSERVFIDDQIVKAFEPFKESHPILTYFANSLEFNGKSTPYSFVSTIDDNNLKDNEIIINDWVSSDLNVKPGDSLKVKYYEIGPLRQLIVKETPFIVKEIVPIKGRYADKDLMPFLPGMSDAGHCRDWEAGVPIKLESIRDKDEAYWNQHKGTPKAFISLNKAHQIWANRFGNYTAIRIGEKSFSDKEYRTLFSASIKPANLGVIVTAVRANGLKAARNGIDFSQLFLGLSFFLLVAALILTALLFLLNLESRQSQIGTLLILGFTRNQIRKLLFSEGVIVALFGSLIGLVIAVFYTKMIFIALNSLWWEVVRTSVLEITIKVSTLTTGLIISMLITVLTIIYSTNRSFKRQAVELQRQQNQSQKPLVASVKKILIVISFILAVGFVVFQLIFSDHLGSSLFFLSGGLLMIGLMLLADYLFRRSEHRVVNDFSIRTLNRRNRSQNLSRSLTVVILFALGTFLVVSTGANRQDLLSNAGEKSSGTGGFQFFAETSIPVLYSLNDKDRRLNEGLTSDFSAAQFSRMDGDDASCLNLNRVSNPAILGADPELLNERFSFAAKSPEIKDDKIWEALNEPLTNGVVPAIADQTVIQWGLGLNIGDTLKYRNELGDTLRLKLIAGLSPSVFQGYVLISNANFLKNFPTTSGSNLFLIDVPIGKAEKTGEELRTVFRDYGWEMTTAAQRLMEFNSVTNTYLSIFLALGALGLILGTVGLTVVLARTILERKKEIAMMQSLGFTRKQVIGLLVREYLVLLVWGISIGFISAVVAVLPNFLSPGNDVSFLTVVLIILGILANGMIWITVLSWLGLRKKSLIENLTT
ncbi:MAG: FtsX-like permease family protein [Bacteroidia bacterium]|nr:FtsX-like permease family protein [Bacteroidia bacterium]